MNETPLTPKADNVETQNNSTPRPTFTPGPWDDASNYPEYNSVRIFAKSHHIATVGNSDDTKAQTEANARLISKAPEMFKKLVEYAAAFPDEEALRIIAEAEGAPSVPELNEKV